MRCSAILTPFSLIFWLLIALSSSYAEVFYKWQDDSGNWVYGEHPPTGITAIEIKTHSNRDSGLGDRSDEMADQAVKAELKADRLREDYCKRARENIEALSSEDAIRQRDAEGNVTVLSDEDRAAEMEKAKLALESYC
ncbi:MAG: DUF4124 domain-containing protein [Pseudomonadales bacterium]